MLYIFSVCSYKISKFLSQLISYFGPREGVDVFFVGNIYVVPVVELKRHVPYIGVFCVIISKFCHEKEPCPIVLLIINENFKVNFYCAILLLRLSVSLSVKSSIELLFDAQKVA